MGSLAAVVTVRGAALALALGACALAARSAAADCAVPGFDAARDAEIYSSVAESCAEARHEGAGADTSALLGYLHRNGYGVVRDPERAAEHFESALAEDPCNARAVCGLRGIEGGGAAPSCDVDCRALAAENAAKAVADAETSARDRAYRLLAEMQRSGEGPVRLAADDLAATLERILGQERELRDEAYRELCVGHVKRAVVTVSLAYQLEREARRRARLIAHHEAKVAESNDARSQAALQSLDAAQRRAVADRQVFFEKYTGAVFAAGDCRPETLDDAYERFEREIAEVRVTDLERQAFGLLRDHVEDARAGRGIGSGWFGNLEELLD